MDRQQKKGFTLVELVVVISILAILGTLGILSLKGYKEKTRDSTRLANINTLMKALDIYKSDNGGYPLPDNYTNVVYSGSTVWTQGLIGQEVVNSLDSIKNVFIDPLTKTQYPYSITSDRKEYEISSILETNDLVFNTTNITNAVERKYLSYVVGNYNRYSTKFKKGTKTYKFFTPSILTTDLSKPDITDIFRNKSFVFNGFGNIADGYDDNDENIEIDMDGNFDFGGDEGNVLLFGGPEDSLSDFGSIYSIASKSIDIISGSDLENIEPYSSILAVDLLDDNEIVSTLTETLVSELEEEDIYIPSWHTDVDTNCKIPDIKIKLLDGTIQTWAGCNSTVGGGYEYTDTNTYACRDYAGGDYQEGEDECSTNLLLSSKFEENYSEQFEHSTNPGFDNIWGRMYLRDDLKDSNCLIQSDTGGSCVCPSGWHIPSSAEFLSLQNSINNDSDDGWKNHYNFSDENNVVNFLKMPLSGYLKSNLAGSDRGDKGFLLASNYTNDDPNSDSGYGLSIERNKSDISIKNDFENDFGYPVRCIRDIN